MHVIGLVSSSRLFLDFASSFLCREQLGEVSTWPSLRAALSDWRAGAAAVDVLIVDWPGEVDRIELSIHRLKRDHPQCRLILLADGPNLDRLALAFSAGADGVLSKGAGCMPLIHALQLVLVGEKVFPSELAAMIAALADRERALGHPGPLLPALDGRERAVAARVANGMPNKAIAQDLGVSEAVVKSIVKSILRKHGLSNRTQLAIRVYKTWKTVAESCLPGDPVAS